MRVLLRVAWCVAVVAGCSASWMIAAEELNPKDLRKAVSLTTKADKALRAGSFSKARDLYQKALETAPDLPAPHLGLGHVAMQEGRFREALESFECARDAYTKMGDVLAAQEALRYDEARKRLVELRSIQASLARQTSNPSNPVGDPRAEARLAQVSVEIERLEAIEMPTDRAESQPPGEIFFFIGNALGRLGRADEALEAWETCAKQDPKHPFVHNNLAVAYWQAGRLTEAQAEVEKAESLGLQINPAFKADLARSVESSSPTTASASRDEND